MSSNSDGARFVDLTAEIISSYISKNAVPPRELANLIADVHGALQQSAGGGGQPAPEPQEPAVPIKRSVTPDALVCLEDGKKFKSLKRHLRTDHNLSPEEYRAKWGLPRDYPMVAPNYAASRSELAKKMGLGRGRQGGEADAADQADGDEAAAAGRTEVVA